MGVTLFVMLSGECPWNQDQSTRGMLTQICAEDACCVSAAWSGVSAPAKRLVRAMPEHRLPPPLVHWLSPSVYTGCHLPCTLVVTFHVRWLSPPRYSPCSSGGWSGG